MKNVTKTVEEKNIHCIFFFNLPRAFRTTFTILYKLYHYGVRRLPYVRLNSYLNNHSLQTEIDEKFLTSTVNNLGVLQWPILGPLLFIIYRVAQK